MSLLPDVIDRYRRERAFEIAEASERRGERLLQVLGRQQTHASDIAATVGSIAVEVSRMAAVADWAMPAIVEHLALTAERLGGVEQMLANPAETAAAEFYRNGTYALSSGWWDDAVTDLSQAVACYRYNPRSWFNLGLAHQRLTAADAATEAYSRCARYGVTAEPALAARAVLLAAFLHRAADQPDASEAILRTYAAKIDRCAEIHLALGVHHQDRDHLARALLLAPDLAVDAGAARASGLEQAAAVVCCLADGPVVRLRTIEQAAAQLADIVHNASVKSVSSPPDPLYLPTDGADALLTAHTALSTAAEAMSQVAFAVRAEHKARQNAAEQTSRDTAVAQGVVLAAMAQAAQLERVLTEDLVNGIVGCMEALALAEDEVEEAQRAEEQADEVVAQASGQIEHAKLLARQAANRTKKKVRATHRVRHEANQLWKRIDTAILSNEAGAQQRVREVRQRFEADDRVLDDRRETLQRDLWALLVTPARERIAEARDQAESLSRAAAQAAREVTEAAEVLPAAQAGVEVAMRMAAPLDRIVPFDVPGGWNDLS